MMNRCREVGYGPKIVPQVLEFTTLGWALAISSLRLRGVARTH